MRKRTNAILTLLAVFASQWLTGALPPPEVRCISVLANGNVTVTWIPPADPNNEFVQYEVYSSTAAGGPYIVDVVTGLATTSFTKVTNANLNSQFYYVVTIYNDGSGPQPSAPSDTLQTILPVFSAVTDSTADITWNPIHVPDLATSLGQYRIFRQIGTNAVTQLGTTSYGNESYSDNFKVCQDTIRYRIEIDDASGCISASSVLKDLFEDNTPPAIPFFDSVSVDNVTKKPVMGWKPSTSPDVDGYIIVFFDSMSGQDILIDTVWGASSTFYMDNAPDPYQAYQQYKISAFDNCYKGTPPEANTSPGSPYQRTIYLEAVNDPCNEAINLYWTPYIGWPDLARYDIMLSVNGSPYFRLQGVGANDSTFVHTNVGGNKNYCYKVVAVTQGDTKTSTSNIACSVSAQGVSPKVHYLKQVTVKDNTHISTSCYTDKTLPVSAYTLERSLTDDTNSFFEVNRIPYVGDTIISIDDYSAKFNATHYYYRIGIIDTCGQPVFHSKPVNSIYLQGELNEVSLDVTLSWTPYTGWDQIGSGVQKYEIYRVFDGTRDTTLIGTANGNTTTYSDNLTSVIVNGARFCYYVVAVEYPNDIYGFSESSTSNMICFAGNLKVWVPNAFSPDGVNNVFKPVISFGDVSTYRLYIYDRWGSLIFETNDIEQGWDGNINGKPAPLGMYVYRVEIANFTGDMYNRKGSFTLVR